MSESENPARRVPEHRVTIEDVRHLMGSSTPHFALQIRGRIARLIRGLDEDDPARRLGEQEIARLERLAFEGETRGLHHEPGIPPLPSVSDPAA